MKRSRSSRRSFLRNGARAIAGGAAAFWVSGVVARADEFKSKNDRPRIGLIGIGSRGTAVAKQAARFGDVVAVCDLDREHAEKAQAAYPGKPEIYEDYRKLLDRKDVDVVTNATPDHWHTIINMAACRAGKDVYAEKPFTLTIDEGKLLLNVVQETGRIIQVGAQQRSEEKFQTAVELVRNGRVGKLQQVWVALPYFSTKGGPFPTLPVPTTLNWEVYQGQAPLHDYCPQRVHSNFRWWYEYAGGIVTDWGNHHVDIAQWGMDCERSGPTSVDARGLFPNPKGVDYYNTPDRFFARIQYASGLELLYFASLNQRLRYGQVQEHAVTTPEEIEWLFGKDVPEEIKTSKRDGITFVGDQGRIMVNRGGLYGKPVEDLKDNPLPGNAWRAYPSTDHMANFFECAKTRKQPCSPPEIEHRTISVCHLVNLSIRLKRKLAWDPEKQQIVGDDEANSWLKRQQRAPYTIA